MNPRNCFSNLLPLSPGAARSFCRVAIAQCHPVRPLGEQLQCDNAGASFGDAESARLWQAGEIVEPLCDLTDWQRLWMVLKICIYIYIFIHTFFDRGDAVDMSRYHFFVQQNVCSSDTFWQWAQLFGPQMAEYYELFDSCMIPYGFVQKTWYTPNRWLIIIFPMKIAGDRGIPNFRWHNFHFIFDHKCGPVLYIMYAYLLALSLAGPSAWW